MTEGVIATDNKSEITRINEAAGSLLNKNPSYIISKNITQVLPIEGDIAQLIENQKDNSIIIDSSEDDSIYLLRVDFSAIFDPHQGEKKASGYIAVLSDVTEEERVEQERREFVSNVSHELRTPLTTLRSYTEALIDGAWKDPMIAPKFLEVTQNETERMIRMVNSLLQLSKMDSKELTFQWESVNFAKYFHSIIDRFEMNVKDENITFIRQIPKEQFHVRIDKDRMTQVLDNIISNAVKYSPDGGKITCKLEKQYRQSVVSIRDEGIGIEYDKIDKDSDRL